MTVDGARRDDESSSPTSSGEPEGVSGGEAGEGGGGEHPAAAPRPGLKRAAGSEQRARKSEQGVPTPSPPSTPETSAAEASPATASPPSAAAAPPPEEPASDAPRIALPSFEGPLDLLLHLIQKHELDILDIPVSFVTEKYLAYLNVMRELSIDVASEYLVMAATLTHIKSKMLLPDVPDVASETEEEEEADPRGELIRRLLEYQKYKAAGEALGRREMLGKDVFPRGAEEFVPVGPAPFAQIGTFELLDAFAKLLERTNKKIEHEIVFDRISISDRITEVVAAMQSKRQMPFEELFQTRTDRAPTRFDLIITFLAVLEMARLKMLRVYQAESLASIFVELVIVTDEESAAPAPEEAPSGEDDDHAT